MTVMPARFDPTPYQFDTDRLLTPALAIYPQLVRGNIRRILQLLGGDTGRWRPHLKTVKVPEILQLLVQAGVSSAKCATTRELLIACQTGFRDVLVAFPHSGPNAARIVEIARQYPSVRVSTLLEAPEQIANWTGTPVGVFIDINPGMDRTGMQGDRHDVLQLAQAIRTAGLEFRGLHFYDGHATERDLEQRTQAAHKRYDDLLGIAAAIEQGEIKVPEIVTSGTPALPCALSYAGFTNSSFRHNVSPGTVIYNDLSSLQQLSPDYGLRPAAVVISRVVSHPKPGVITCDAGHKSVSVDSGVPNCAVMGEPGLAPMKPSEEHLPIAIASDASPPALGSILYLLPRHICPTVNNANYAVLVEDGAVSSIVEVTARGHERPL